MLNSKNGFAPAGIIALIAAGAIILLGGITVGVMKLSQKTETACEGAACPSATSTVAFPEPDWSPKTQCGDNVCNPNEKANPNVCPQDCTITKEVPKPVIESFTATPNSIVSGKSVTLSWSSTSSFCASAGDESSWFATGGASAGSVETKSLATTRTFILSCMAEDGATITKSVTVSVTPPAKPVVTVAKIPAITYFAAEPATVVKGKSAKLSWTTKDTSSCTASGGSSSWAGTRPVNGSFDTPELTEKQIYALTCTGNNRTATQRVTVNVSTVPPGPSITFTATPSKVAPGEKATLVWLSASAASCTAGGSGESWGWTGSIGTSGTQTTPALKESQMFTITCVNKDGGSTTKSTQISVSAPKATLTLSPSTQSVSYGKAATLKWTSSGVISCTGSGPWADSGSFGLSDTKFTQALTASAIFEITCTGDGGSVTQKATVNVGEAAGCSFSGKTISDGSSVTAYQSSSVAYNQTCASETRTCANGTLSGTYTYSSCTVGAAKNCSYKDTSTAIGDGKTINAYTSAQVPFSETCETASFSCSGGVLTPATAYENCKISAAAVCTTSHKKGYTCTITQTSLDGYSIYCPNTGETEHGECRSTWDNLTGENQCDTWPSSGLFGGDKGWNVSLHLGKYRFTTIGKENNHSSPYWSTRTCDPKVPAGDVDVEGSYWSN